MLGNSFNLVDMIRTHLTGEAIGRMSSVIGENSDRTRAGIAAAIPGILGSLDRAASNPDGVRRITTAIDDAEENVLDNVPGTMGKSVMSEAGSGIVRSIIGTADHSDLLNRISSSSGLSEKSSSSILAMLAPIVFAVLAKLRRTSGSNFDIRRLLAAQRLNIAAASREGRIEETYEGEGVGARERVAETYTPSRSESHVPSWIVPLALLAGALGLLWYWGSRPTRTQAAYENVNPKAGTVLSLDRLRMKYGSVLREARMQGVQISEVARYNDKLFIKGTAPSLDAANKVWDEIKRVNPGLDDIMADFQVENTTGTMPATPDRSRADTNANQPSESSSPSATTLSGRMYTVQKGDTLGSISKRFYGSTKDYKRIFDANREKLHNQNVITVGQELSIPQ